MGTFLLEIFPDILDILEVGRNRNMCWAGGDWRVLGRFLDILDVLDVLDIGRNRNMCWA